MQIVQLWTNTDINKVDIHQNILGLILLVMCFGDTVIKTGWQSVILPTHLSIQQGSAVAHDASYQFWTYRIYKPPVKNDLQWQKQG